MFNKNKYLQISFAVASLLAATQTHAQPSAAAYPVKPVRVIVPFPAGGGLDMIVRVVTQKMSENTRQPFVIENRSGANSIVGMDADAKSVPDGYTLIATTTGSHTINPNVHAKLPFDVTRDLLPVTNFGEAPFVLVCHPSLAARNVRELVAFAKSRPAELNYGSPGVGDINHLGMELFAQLSGGLRLTHITFKGSAPLLIDLMGGHVMLALDSIQATTPHIKTGRMRALGLAAPKRSPVTPDMPTITELRERLFATGVTPIGNTPAEFAAVVKADLAKWAKVVRVAGVKVE